MSYRQHRRRARRALAAGRTFRELRAARVFKLDAAWASPPVLASAVVRQAIVDVLYEHFGELERENQRLCEDVSLLKKRRPSSPGN